MEPHQQLCPKFEAAFRLLGKRWSGLIIQVMMSGPKRFKELSEAINGVSDRVLTERLKELEEAGILVRRVYPETPVRIEYELTEKGYDLRAVMQATQKWGETWF
jgi:DNA-binding HxlR family transcriptional regulator